MIQEDFSRKNIYKFMSKDDLEPILRSKRKADEVSKAYEKSVEDLKLVESNFLYKSSEHKYKNKHGLDKRHHPSARKVEERKFNSLLNGVEKSISKTLWSHGREISEYASEMRYKYSSYPQVFLSYAHKDKPYTLALFQYFLSFDIYLHVDWMHNPALVGGLRIKTALSHALIQSNQLLVLLSKNQELLLSGNKSIRPWCAWEIGNFYSMKGGGEQYFLRLYSDLESTDIAPSDNVFVEDMQKLSGIGNRKLY